MDRLKAASGGGPGSLRTGLLLALDGGPFDSGAGAARTVNDGAITAPVAAAPIAGPPGTCGSGGDPFTGIAAAILSAPPSRPPPCGPWLVIRSPIDCVPTRPNGPDEPLFVRRPSDWSEPAL